MDQVYDNLYVGDVNDADNPKKLDKNNIKYILNVSGTTTESETAPSYEIVRDKNYFHIPISDDGENTDFMLKTVIELAKDLHNKATEENVNLLINCSVGLSRSPTVAAAVTSIENNERVHTNIGRIKKVRSGTKPHPDLLTQANRLAAEIFNDRKQ